MISAVLALWLLAVPPASCDDALAAQDEVIRLQDGQIAELHAAIDERKAQVAALEREVAALKTEADTYRRMWLAGAEFTAAEHKKAVWAERFTAFKWGAVGLSAGILVERFAE